MEMPPGPPVPGPSGPPPAPDPGSPPPPGEQPTPAPDGLLADEAANRRLVATVAALALVAVALMIGFFLVTRDGDDDDVATPEPEAVPSATTLVDEATEPPADVIDQAELDALLVELQAVVEEERGLEFREPIEVELLDDETYIERSRADFDEDIAEDPDDLQNAAAALGALGLWPEDVDPVDVLGEFLSVGSLGYYDPETGEMVVRGAADTPNLRITLVHELTHALDDQHFELDRPELDDRPDEAGLGFSALVEGSASRVETAYTDSLTDEERADAAAEQEGYVEGLDLTAFPQILLAQQQFVYQTGGAFVAAIHEAGGNAAVDQAMEDPPTTSEQILEPTDWPERDDVVAVDAPEADGEVVDEATAGQFLIQALTGLSEDEPTPEWDGDRDCLRMAIAGDVEALATGLTPWAEQVGATVEVDGDLLVVTSCR